MTTISSYVNPVDQRVSFCRTHLPLPTINLLKRIFGEDLRSWPWNLEGSKKYRNIKPIYGYKGAGYHLDHIIKHVKNLPVSIQFYPFIHSFLDPDKGGVLLSYSKGTLYIEVLYGKNSHADIFSYSRKLATSRYPHLPQITKKWDVERQTLIDQFKNKCAERSLAKALVIYMAPQHERRALYECFQRCEIVETFVHILYDDLNYQLKKPIKDPLDDVLKISELTKIVLEYLEE